MSMNWELIALVLAIIVALLVAIYFFPQLIHLGQTSTGPLEEGAKTVVGP